MKNIAKEQYYKPVPFCCGKGMVRKPKQFYYRGKWFPGLVCECGALYDDPENSFLKYVTEKEKTCKTS